jgi:hypothetical protein
LRLFQLPQPTPIQSASRNSQPRLSRHFRQPQLPPFCFRLSRALTKSPKPCPPHWSRPNFSRSRSWELHLVSAAQSLHF